MRQLHTERASVWIASTGFDADLTQPYGRGIISPCPSPAQNQAALLIIGSTTPSRSGLSVWCLPGLREPNYLKGLYGAPSLSLLVHIHGVVMTLWYALLWRR